MEQPGIPAAPKVIQPAIDDTADVAYSALLIRMESSSLYRRLMYMRGCPDAMIVNPPGPRPTKAWLDAYEEWANELNKGAWGFKALLKEGPNAPRFINGMVVVANQTVVQVTDHTFKPGDMVRIESVKGASVPRGVYAVDPINPTSFSLRGAPLGLSYDRGGTYQAQVRGIVPIVNVLVRGQTRRATGRPFDSPVGRRAKKKNK
jgi:hypothetical protein